MTYRNYCAIVTIKLDENTYTEVNRMVDLHTDLELTNSLEDTERLEQQEVYAAALLEGSVLQFADLLPIE